MCSPDPCYFAKQFKKPGVWLKAALFALLAIGGSVPASASTGPVPERLTMLRERDLRVASVAYRLSLANVSLCDRLLTPQLGFVLHRSEQIEAPDRLEAARSFAPGDNVGVMAVVPGSAAGSAGLVAGDTIESVNGRSVTDDTEFGAQTRGRVESVRRILIEATQSGPVRLRVSAAGRSRELRFKPALGCPADVELVPGPAVNAWADGSHVIVSEGLLAKCVTDDELALVIGHELAHNLLHHRRRLAAEGVTAPTLLPMTDALSQKVRETEEEADRIGVSLAIRAGYDLADAERFMAGLLDPAVSVAATHPRRYRRLLLLHRAIVAARRGLEPRVSFSGEVLPPS